MHLGGNRRLMPLSEALEQATSILNNLQFGATMHSVAKS